MHIEYRSGTLNHVPDALSRMNEEDPLEAITAIRECEETSHTWYKKMFEQIVEKLED